MRSLSVLVALILTVGLAGPARANSKVIDDGPDVLPARMDLLTVAIDNRQRVVVLKLQFRGLQDGRRANARVLVNPRPRDDVAFIAYSKRTSSGQTVSNLQVSTDDEFGGRPIKCRGFMAQWSTAADRLRMIVPQRCMHHNGPIHQFKAVSGFWGSNQVGDYTDFTKVTRGARAKVASARVHPPA